MKKCMLFSVSMVCLVMMVDAQRKNLSGPPPLPPQPPEVNVKLMPPQPNETGEKVNSVFPAVPSLPDILPPPPAPAEVNKKMIPASPVINGEKNLDPPDAPMQPELPTPPPKAKKNKRKLI
ncbi:MAG: hypothetical protein ACSLE0_14305 [Chitinophagaceae bacterium]